MIMASTFSWGKESQPIIVNPIQDITVTGRSHFTAIPLNKVFKLSGVTGPVARFSTSQGIIDVELLPKDAPKTVANFLSYVDRGTYTGTFIHRAVAEFVIQGGGYKYVDGEVEKVAENAPIQNEFKISNTRGTLAMAKQDGNPDSATIQWFFNQSDKNSKNNDTQNGGFTVFGTIIGQKGLQVIDAIGALPTVNTGSPFDALPVVDHKVGDPITNKNLVVVHTINEVPLVAISPKGQGLLKLSLSKNSNPAAVEASISGKNLILKYSGKKGLSIISVTAKYGGGAAADTFRVTVN